MHTKTLSRYRHAFYIEDVLKPKKLKAITSKAVIRLHSMKADAIVVTGVSGLLLGGAVSMKAQMPCIVVRKNTRNCHSDFKIEVPYDVSDASKIVFIDDLVSSGATLRRVIGALSSVGLSLSDTILNYSPELDTILIGNKRYSIENIGLDKKVNAW